MFEVIQNNEAMYRICLFSIVLIIFVLWELFSPRHIRFHSRWSRWPNNLGMMGLNTVILRFLSPIAAIGIATNASAYGWGIFNLVQLPLWLELILAVILLDASIYFQHKMFHAVPILWKVHRLHHTDIDFDVTTGVRFHPIEIILSMLIKFFVIILLGIHPVAVIFFEILLSTTALFTHANISLPTVVERNIRLFIVTPDMHRVHHSIDSDEMNSNYGFCLPWWDHLFGTYCAQPKKGHKKMIFGTSQFRSPKEQRFINLLIQPMKDKSQH